MELVWAGLACYMRFEVGNGSKVLFQYDVCCGELPLKVLFPELFTIACGKDVWVVENMQINNGIIHWNILLTRPMQDWEVDEVARFFELLYYQKVRYGDEDKICWIPLKRKSFKVKSYYQVLSTPRRSTFSWKSIWKVKISPQVAFFVWMATLGKILTLDSLHTRNIIVFEWCCSL